MRRLLSILRARSARLYEAVSANAYYFFANSLRRIRYAGLETRCCESCGFIWPTSELNPHELANGEVVDHCDGCRAFRIFVQQIFKAAA